MDGPDRAELERSAHTYRHRVSGHSLCVRLPFVGRRTHDERKRSDGPGKRPSRRWIYVAAAGLLVVVGAGAWLAVRGREARTAMAQLQLDGGQLQQQLAGYDLAGVLGI